MIEFTHYYGRYQDLRGRWTGLPPWAQTIVGILAIPGIILVGLSVLAFLVSLLALLLLTVPAYRLLSSLTGSRRSVASAEDRPGVKHVDVTIIE
jgi:hypothetical protein